MLNKLKNDIIKYGKLAGEKNLTPSISGNISARFNDMVLITATGSANGYLEEEDITLIDFNGKVVEGKRPSSERFLHLEFYKTRPDINAIFHVHSPYLTAFASAGQSLENAVSPEIVYCFDKIPLAKYALPGSEELVKNTMKFKDYDVILMQNHGVIVGGKDVKDAYLKLELAETYAQTILFSKILGGAKILSDNQVKEIYLLKN